MGVKSAKHTQTAKAKRGHRSPDSGVTQRPMGGLREIKPVVLGLAGVLVVVVLIYNYWSQPNKKNMATEDVVTAARLDSVPELDEAALESLDRESKEIDVVVGDKTVKVHVEQVVRKSDQSKLDVLFLHGQKFSSANWLEIKSTDHVANWGYRAIAIDLPGKGKSPEAIDESLYAEFLDAFISYLKLENVVIIAPSASGRVALPYLFDDPQTSTEKAKGFVPIAPVSTHDFVTKYPESQLPTLIVYGTKDIQGAITLNDLMLLPKHEIAPIEGAGHACYMDKPENFHKLLYHFFSEVAK